MCRCHQLRDNLTERFNGEYLLETWVQSQINSVFFISNYWNQIYNTHIYKLYFYIELITFNCLSQVLNFGGYSGFHYIKLMNYFSSSFSLFIQNISLNKFYVNKFGNRVVYLSAGFQKSVCSELPTQEKLYSQDSQHTLLTVHCNGCYWNTAHAILRTFEHF